MKKLFVFLILANLLCLAACGRSDKESSTYVSLTDIAAEAVPTEEIVPADVNEVAIATEEILLAQPIEFPAEQPSGEPSYDPAEEAPAPAEEE